MKLETQQLIIERAKSKKDGVYRFRGVEYRVKNFRATHYAAHGELFESAYGFNVLIGKYDWDFTGGAGTKLLKSIKT